MRLFDVFKDSSNVKEQRDESVPTSITSLFSKDIILSEDTVLAIPTVKSCYELIAGAIAQLPIYLYREDSNGSVEKITHDNRCYLLNDEPNEFQTAYSFKKQMLKDYLFRGVCYSYIERDGNDVVELHNINASHVRVIKYVQDGFKTVDVDINVSPSHTNAVQRKGSSDNLIQTLKLYDCIVALKDASDIVSPKGILHYGRDVFKVATEEKNYTASIYKNGALPLGILKTSGRLTKNALDNLKASWQSLYTGSENAGKTVILEEGLDYSAVSLKPGDLLLTDNRKDVISDICKLFNLPESLIDVTKIKYGSLEQNNIHFLQYTLSPVITSLEHAISKSLLLEDEKKDGYFFAFDASEVLKSTDREKYDAVKVALDSGVMSINEARYRVNLPSINDDVMKWSLGSVLYYPATGDMKIPNMGIGISSDNSVEEESDETVE